MTILFAFMIISIITFVFISFYNHRYSNASVTIVFLVGLTIMIIANTIYQVHMGGLSHAWIKSNRTLYDFIINIKFSFSSIQQISLIGEIIVLFSILLITNVTVIKKAKWFILYALLLLLYFIINTPDILYNLYLSINSNDRQTAIFARNIYNALYISKLIIVTFVFMLPFITCIYKYFKYTFSIIKRNNLIFAAAMILLETLIVILINTEYIHSFFTLNLTIFYSNSSTILVAEKVITIILGIFVLFILLLIIRSRLFNRNYFDVELFSMYDGSKKLDRTLRMILHTYKNMFLAINQLSKTALTTSSIKDDDNSNSFVNSIQEISKDALYNITHLLYMLTNVEITPQLLDIKEIIDNAVAKINIDNNNLKLIIDCPPNTYLINSDSLYMTDLIYNVYKNSCDAVESVANPEIKISVRSEDEWLLIKIEDNGYGIPADIKKQIFKPLISNKQGTNNWGIGLYYSKKIVKAHNGHIFVESKPNKYTKFEIYLPVPKAQ